MLTPPFGDPIHYAARGSGCNPSCGGDVGRPGCGGCFPSIHSLRGAIMTDTQQIVVEGVRNAHAMQNQALAIMRPQLSRIENYPEVARMLEKHIAETEGQIQRLEAVLDGI